MSSKAETQFADLVAYVDQLIAIHGKLQTGKGRRHEQDAIHRSGVVLMVAAWESYVEKVVLEALEAIELNAGVPPAAAPGTTVPAWAKHAFSLRRAEIAKSVKRFNTPSAVEVRDLMLESLEFNPWTHWTWHAGPRQWDEKVMRAMLNDWVQIRHSVAHGFALPNDIAWLKDSHDRPRLNLSLLRECKWFFERLVTQTDAAFGAFLNAHHGIATPW